MPPYKPKTGAYSLDDFALFCSTLELEDGAGKLVLEPFERLILTPYFDGTPETAVIIPKKNGKSSIVGALALYHLLNRSNADVILAAAARDQAKKVLNFAAGFVYRTKWLQNVAKVQEGYGRIITLDDEDHGTIRVVPADAKTVDGEAPTLALVDEYHRHKSSELYGILRDGLPARNGQLISISTAGDSEESPLGKLRTAALALPNIKRVDCLTTASGAGLAYFEWSLDDNDDVTDFELVKKANPLSIHTCESLRARYESPTMEDWQWRRFACGQWVGGEGSAIDPIIWRTQAKKAVELNAVGLEEGEPCWLGMDLAWVNDSQGLVPFLYDEENSLEVVGVPTIIYPPKNGRIKSSQTIAAIKKIHARNPIEVIVFDPNAEANSVLEAIEELGIEVREHSQNPGPMAEACMGLAEAIREGKVVHPDDAELNAHILAAGMKPLGYGSDRWHFVKQRGGRKIDAAVALAMVRHFRMVTPKKKGMDFDELQRLMNA